MKNFLKNLLSKKNLAWEERELIQESIQEQKKVTRETQEIAKLIGNRLSELEEEFVVDQKGFDKKLKEVSCCIQEVETIKMRQTVKKLQCVTRDRNPVEIENAIQVITFNQAELKKCLVKTFEVLKTMKQVEEFKALLQIA